VNFRSADQFARFSMHSPSPVKRPRENMIALINIIFLLLIFFMLAGTLSAVDPIEGSAPESISTLEKDDQSVSVMMSRDGEFALGANRISRVDMLESVANRLSNNPNLRVRFVADGELPADSMVAVLKALGDLGLQSLTLATEHKP